MIVLDACVLIAHLDATDVHHERATRLLAESGDLRLHASVLTLAETLVGPVRTGRGHHVQQALTRLGVTPLGLPADIAVELAAVRARTGLKMPDAVVLLTAETHHAALATFDDKLRRAASSRDVAVYPDA
ncbi:MAG: type II toxin-antitoxin system VapC family toxin [Kutzneria sp.]|nr:type II toxin-antitoxin system VapC family toxin [Kutzneria sp.]